MSELIEPKAWVMLATDTLAEVGYEQVREITPSLPPWAEVDPGTRLKYRETFASIITVLIKAKLAPVRAETAWSKDGKILPWPEENAHQVVMYSTPYRDLA